MRLLHKRCCRIIVALFLSLFIFATQTVIALKICRAYDNAVLLNDRAADITGSTPLLAPGFLSPSGLSGKGQIVGIADSGLDKGSIIDIHPDLQSEAGAMPRVAMLKSYSARAVPDDPNGHGTHMAATIAGSGKASDGKYRGIAPGASLYFQALLDAQGQLRIPDNINDLFSPAYAAGVRVHVNGWGSSENAYTGNTAQIDNYVTRHPDFLPVFGAGNNGPVAGSVTTEANSKNALVVGSSQVPRPAFSNDARYANQAAASSSRGPAQDGRIKPDLLAPGSAIVSACSSLTVSNFPANPQYAVKGGSSMAAAVTGGSLALLREYLNMHKGFQNPSSALLKSLLVNGAKTGAAVPSSGQGFGILDLLGTVLAMEEDRFNLVEATTGICNGESREYKVHVNSENEPLKATLAWIDPPAANGANPALINNLDLLIKDPQGKIYYGNDFLCSGSTDQVNNIEQITIPQTIAGEYTVFVKGARLDAAYPAQAYALVYGQPLRHGIVQRVEKDGRFYLDSGANLDLASLKAAVVLNGQNRTKLEQVTPGTDIYVSDKSAYLVGKNYDIGSAQVLSGSGANMLMEINTRYREGGFSLDPQLISDGQTSLLLNDQPLDGIDKIPIGATVHMDINPGLQTIWQIKAEYGEIQGFIEKLSSDKKEIKLVQNNTTYRIAQDAAISYNDQLIDCNDINLPFGSAETASLDELAPGMKVNLIVAPASNLAQYIKVNRDIVIGEIQAVEASGAQLTLDTGKSYKIFAGAQLFKDGQKVSIAAIEPGLKIAALLLPGTNDITQLQALSNVAYGQVAYYNAKNRSLFLFDTNSGFKVYELKPDTEVFKRGIQVDASSIESGKWVRVIVDKSGKGIWRVDIAEAVPASIKTLHSVDLQQKNLNMEDGSSYQYSAQTSFIKGGYKFSPDLLLPGDRLLTSTLDAIYPRSSFLARVEAVINPGVKNPELKAEAYSLNGVLIIQGYSNANRIVLFRSDGTHMDITAGKDGSFNVIYKLQDKETKVRILAMDSLSGGISGLDLNIRDFPAQRGEPRFYDISGHPAEEHILNLAKQGIISGYGDGTFRPQQLLSRAEFLSMLGRARNWDIEAWAAEPSYFKDNRQIPWWAAGAVYAARKLGVISGYPDGSFRPRQAVTRGEAAAIMDLSFPGETTAGLTRGEAAAIIDQAVK